MLLDTSGLLAYVDSAEPRHSEAVRLFETSPQVLLHNVVIAEFVALGQARRLPRGFVLEFAFALTRLRRIDMVWIDKPLHNTAVNLLNAQRDKSYSLCDAVSFVLMRERNVTDALTTDKHFEQAQFRRLLGP